MMITDKSASCARSGLTEVTLGDLLERDGIERTWGLQNLAFQPAPDATAAMQVSYPAGSRAPSVSSAPMGGAGFYLPFDAGGYVASACLRYRVFFPESFDFTRGGKLPGIYGGVDRAPSGGARPTGDDGFSLRLMWRTDGAGEVYLYAPNMVPSSRAGGMEIGTGVWRFERGRWTDIVIETRLNQPGLSNGIARLWVDDQLIMGVKGIRYRETDAMGIKGVMFSTFFGGKSADFAPATDQSLYFADFAWKTTGAYRPPVTFEP